MRKTEDMSFEVNEAERVFDFVNLAFGAFLSAYLGIKLAQSPDQIDMARMVGLLIIVAFVGLSLRGLGIPLITGIATLKHSITSLVTLVAGGAGYVIVCRDLGFPLSIMGPIGIGWLLAPLIAVIPLILR